MKSQVYLRQLHRFHRQSATLQCRRKCRRLLSALDGCHLPELLSTKRIHSLNIHLFTNQMHYIRQMIGTHASGRIRIRDTSDEVVLDLLSVGRIAMLWVQIRP